MNATSVLLDAIAEADAQPYDTYLITQAHGVFTRAKSAEWPEPGRRAIGNAVLDLAEALKRYSDLRNGFVPRYLPGIKAGPEGFTEALQMLAEGAWEAAGDVTEAIGKYCDEETAALVSGTEGGEGA